MKLMLASRRGILNIIGLSIAVYLVTILVGVVKHNNDLRGQISSLELQIATLQTQQAELNYKIHYYQTDSFKEKQARANLGLQKPGEGVVILPNTTKASTETVAKAATSKTSNIKQWFNFLFGKGQL